MIKVSDKVFFQIEEAIKTGFEFLDFYSYTAKKYMKLAGLLDSTKSPTNIGVWFYEKHLSDSIDSYYSEKLFEEYLKIMLNDDYPSLNHLGIVIMKYAINNNMRHLTLSLLFKDIKWLNDYSLDSIKYELRSLSVYKNKKLMNVELNMGLDNITISGKIDMTDMLEYYLKYKI